MSDTATLAERLEKVIRANRTAGRHRAARPGQNGHRPAHADGAPSALASLSAAVASAVEERPEAPPASAPFTEAPAMPRALVVEADPFHRQVLARLVENLGYAVDSTGTAEEGVAAFERQPYALVLLDCDSGETRGLETAAAMRRAEGGEERTPIIAVTVRAAQEDRQQRQAAGIDNYIARPILRENVVSLLSRHAPAGPAEAPETVSRYLALDRHRLGELEQAAGNSVELLRGWIAMFLSGAPDLLERMQAAEEAGDAGALCEAATQLRSHSGQIGALRVQEICGIVAALGESGGLAGVEALLPELSIALERAVGELCALEEDIRRGRRLAAAASSGNRPGRPNRVAAGRNHALLAEPDPLIARFLANSLTGAGFAVTQVSGGAAAIKALSEKVFGVVILDLDVSEVDGYSVLSQIRMRADAATPVMIVSSRHQEQDILRAFELGADDYVTIPFSPLEVVARVRRLARQGAYVS